MPWFLAYGQQQFGPLDDAQARTMAAQNPNGLAWRDGFPQWIPIMQVAELLAQPVAPGQPPQQQPPPPQQPAFQQPAYQQPAYQQPVSTPAPQEADEITYKVVGAEMQFVEVELDPGKSMVSEAGAMFYKDVSINMDAVFGDGSAASAQGGLMDKLVGAGKRLLGGAGLFITVFTNQGQAKARVAFGAPYPGNIIPIKLTDVGGTLICQKDSFLCAARGVTIGIFFQKKVMTGLFGGEGFIMERLDGNGMIFMHAGGTIVERMLAPGEMVHVDTGCVVALEQTVQFDVQRVGNIKTSLFGGEGLFMAVMQGPGRIWLQSLPFSRLAGRMLQAAPQRGGHKDEGSGLPGFSFFGGDDKE